MGVTVPLIDKPLIAAKTATTEVGAADVAGCANLTFYVVGNGAVSAGAVTLEESHDVNFAGAWTPIGTAVTVIANGVAVPTRFAGTAKAVRARITTTVTGGTVTVHLVGR
jgi:hypothetical protein